MCLYTHIAVGAVAGAIAPNPILAAFMGLGSHVALDYIPHYDFEGIKTEVLLGTSMLILLVILGVLSSNALIGALAGALPDLENLFWKLGCLPEEKKLFFSHSGLIPHGRAVGSGNLVLQTVISTVSVLLLYNLR